MEGVLKPIGGHDLRQQVGGSDVSLDNVDVAQQLEELQQGTTFCGACADRLSGSARRVTTPFIELILERRPASLNLSRHLKYICKQEVSEHGNREGYSKWGER